MKNRITEYKTLVFDCDGVILDSNTVKTVAFHNAALAYGLSSANALVDYHKAHGGVSRFKKFEYFFESILNKNVTQSEFNSVVDRYAAEVSEGLLFCDIAEGIEELRTMTHGATWLIASGGAEVELLEVFKKRGLKKYFDGGIFGSPTPKGDIFDREIDSGNIKRPAIFFGDSKFDHIVAQQYNIDFVFIAKWSEFSGLDDYAMSRNIKVVNSLADIAYL